MIYVTARQLGSGPDPKNGPFGLTVAVVFEDDDGVDFTHVLEGKKYKRRGKARKAARAVQAALRDLYGEDIPRAQLRRIEIPCGCT